LFKFWDWTASGPLPAETIRSEIGSGVDLDQTAGKSGGRISFPFAIFRVGSLG
jgi:hypothetical protein